MSRYLVLSEVESALTRGKSVEVFLGRSKEDADILSWLSLEKSGGYILVTHWDVYDEGSLEFLDIYSFSYVDPDREFKEYSFTALDEALEFIKTSYMLQEISFVNAGLVQEEYRNLLIAEKE